MRLPSTSRANPIAVPRPGPREFRREILRELRRRLTREQLAHALRERAPLLIDQPARFARDGIRFLLVKLRGASFEDDLLLLRAPQRQPAEPDARQHNGEQENPDAPFHEARRRLSILSPAEQQSASPHPVDSTSGRSRDLPHAVHRAAATAISGSSDTCPRSSRTGSPCAGTLRVAPLESISRAASSSLWFSSFTPGNCSGAGAAAFLAACCGAPRGVLRLAFIGELHRRSLARRFWTTGFPARLPCADSPPISARHR